MGNVVKLTKVMKIGLMTLIGLWAGSGCHDKGISPGPVKYNVYVGATTWVGDEQEDWIYVLDADSLSIQDSIPEPHYVDELAVSPDGRNLYVMEYASPGDEDTLRKIDSKSGSTIWARWHPLLQGDGHGGHMFLMDEGRLLYYDHEVIQTSDGSPIRELGDSVWAGTGPIDGTEIACWTRDSTKSQHLPVANIRAVDLMTGEFRGFYKPQLSSGAVLWALNVCLHPDGRLVCCAGIYLSSGTVWFVVGDLESGETLFEHQLNHGRGDVAISPDGSMALMADHRVPGMLEGTDALYAYDLNELRLLKDFGEISCSQLRFVDDGHYLIAAPASSFASSGAMFIIDLQALSVKRESHSIPYIFGGMDVGPAQGK